MAVTNRLRQPAAPHRYPAGRAAEQLERRPQRRDPDRLTRAWRSSGDVSSDIVHPSAAGAWPLPGPGDTGCRDRVARCLLIWVGGMGWAK